MTHRPEAGYVDYNTSRIQTLEQERAALLKGNRATFVALVLSTILNVCLAAALAYMLVTR